MQRKEDHRTAEELSRIAQLAELFNLDVDACLRDPACDLLEVKRRGDILATVRASLKPHFEQLKL